MHFLQNGSQLTEAPVPPLKGEPGFFGIASDGQPSWPGPEWFNASIFELKTLLDTYSLDFVPGSYDHLLRAFTALANQIGSGVPIGTPLPWLTQTPPDGWSIMKGQAFDTDVYPALALIYPDGLIPDMRGCGVIGVYDGETVGIYEEGQVKAHAHGATSSFSGSAVTPTGTFTGTAVSLRGNGQDEKQSVPSASDDLNPSRTWTPAGTIKINAITPSGSVTTTVASTGAERNTINHRKVNWIVRLA